MCFTIPSINDEDMPEYGPWTREQVIAWGTKMFNDGYIQGRAAGEDMAKKELRGMLALNDVLKNY